MEYPTIRICADSRDKLASNTIVINPKYIDGFLWVRIPSYIKNNTFGFIGVAEVTYKDEDVKLYDTVIKDPCHPWIKIKSSFLNHSPGYHVYKFSFVNRFTNDLVSIYCAYQYQMDDPEKPYDYMTKYRTNISED